MVASSLLLTFTLSSCKKDPEPIPEEKVSLYIKSPNPSGYAFTVTVSNQTLNTGEVKQGKTIEGVKGKTIHYQGQGSAPGSEWLLIYNNTSQDTLFFEHIEFKTGAMTPSGTITIK